MLLLTTEHHLPHFMLKYLYTLQNSNIFPDLLYNSMLLTFMLHTYLADESSWKLHFHTDYRAVSLFRSCSCSHEVDSSDDLRSVQKCIFRSTLNSICDVV